MHQLTGRLNKTQGQTALQTAPRRANGELLKIPKETAKEILEFFEAGILADDIAEHFGLSKHQVNWVKHPRSVHCRLLIEDTKVFTHVPLARTFKKEKLTKSVGISEETHKWLHGLSVVFGVKRGEVLDILAKEARKDEKFLMKLMRKK